MTRDADTLFDEANRLWYRDGASSQALDAYRAAARERPDDPVIAFQLGRALWALGRPDEAARALATAEAHSDRLSEFGRSVLELNQKRLSEAPPSSDAADPARLDTDALEPLGLAPDQWRDIARAAEQRGMYGLAAHALARGSTFVSLELERDEHDMRSRASSEVQVLEAMRLEPRPGGGLDVLSGSAAPESPGPPQAARPSPRQWSPIAAPTVEIEVAPSVSGVSDAVVLAVTLANRTGEPIAVNKRLLLNHPSRPPGYGELTLAVEGPPGYENQVMFQIRTGPAQPGDFAVLAPEESVHQTYPLQNYEALHAPGTYRIWVTYRNDVAETVGGRAAFLGAVSSPAVSIERY